MGDIVKDGKLSQPSAIAGFQIMEQQALTKYSTGVYGGSPVVAGAGQSGSTLNISGASGGTTLDVGTVFTVVGLNSVNPQTKENTGVLQQFVVTAKNAAGATQALQIEPAIVPSGERQNVTASPTNGNAITVVGTSGLTGQKFALGYHPLAFTFACADVTGTGGDPTGAIAEGTAQQRIVLEDLGLSMTMTSAFDIRSNKILVRCDLLGGWATIYPQLAVKAFYG
jgi:hypothetical protein